jgi:glycosyltransferase involved in cell wall biosynthesis
LSFVIDEVSISHNAAWDKVHDLPLSICVPYYRFDVGVLADRLIALSDKLRDCVEIVFADDGSGDLAMAQRLREKFQRCNVPTALAIFHKNQGRAIIRNCLIELARGRFAIFLDADMLPDSDDFVTRYLALARQDTADIVVGGCSYDQVQNVSKSQRLDLYHGIRTQCESAEVRNKSAARYVFTNNLMIRRDTLLRLPFDHGYTGWGYEDTDWGFDVVRGGARILHIDNTATHLGLSDDGSLIKKHRESVVNYRRLAQKFPLETATLPVSKAVRLISRLPLPFSILATASEHLVRMSFIPVRIRRVLLQSFRIFMYSALARHPAKP